jgi:hypothetical protein
MALYLCRWENGDFSVVQANNKEHAIEMLDEIANAEGLPLYAISGFMVHFRLADNGTIELEEFGEHFSEHIRKRVYPVLAELDVSPYNAAPEDAPKIQKAVEQERDRVKAAPALEPLTELGKRIKAEMDLPTSVINRHIDTTSRKILQQSKPKGKPS